MKTVQTVLWVLAVACFAIGAIRSDLGNINWTNAGLAFAAAAITAGLLA